MRSFTGCMHYDVSADATYCHVCMIADLEKNVLIQLLMQDGNILAVSVREPVLF